MSRWHLGADGYDGEAFSNQHVTLVCLFLVSGGGKGTWGKNGIMYEDENEDPADPNYDIERVGDEKLVLKEVQYIIIPRDLLVVYS